MRNNILLERLLVLFRLILERSSAGLFKIRGAKIGQKVRFGARVRIDQPYSVMIGSRCQFEADVWLKMATDEAILKIGEFSFLGRGVEINVREKVSIGSHVLIAPGVFITDHLHNVQAGVLIDSQGCSSSAVSINDDVWLGVRSIILPGINIGYGAVVGAGSVVTKNVPDNAVIAGVPAKVIRYRAEDEKINSF